MADVGDVDDFFAKRDKKKKAKGQKKFDTADDVAKVLEQNAAKRKVNDSKSNYVPSNEGEQQPINEYRQQDEDDEWKEVEEKTPDLTNLKIQELILEDEDELEAKEEQGRIDTEMDEKGGPWNQQKKREKKGKESEILPEEVSVGEPNTKIEEEKVPESTSEETTTTTTEPPKTSGYIPPAKRREAELASKLAPESSTPSSTTTTTPSLASSGDASKAYVPPSRRGLAPGATSSSSSSRSTKKPVSAPNIENEEAFPTLS